MSCQCSDSVTAAKFFNSSTETILHMEGARDFSSRVQSIYLVNINGKNDQEPSLFLTSYSAQPTTVRVYRGTEFNSST